MCRVRKSNRVAIKKKKKPMYFFEKPLLWLSFAPLAAVSMLPISSYVIKYNTNI